MNAKLLEPKANQCLYWTVQHKFENEDTHEPEWYAGSIVGYNCATKLLELAYDGETDTCNFDVILDIILGDLVIVL